MRFEVAPELRLFAETVRGAIGAWEPAREPDLGTWLDDRDDALAAGLAESGWDALWEADLGAVVAGGFELGRAVVPLSVLDQATLGAPLSADGRVRHGTSAAHCAVAEPGWGLALRELGSERRPERTLDGSGTVLAEIGTGDTMAPAEADARWNAWTSATLAYLAGIAAAALETSVAHARSREQFGKPLAALPAVQSRLADAALATDGLRLTAWESSTPSAGRFARAPALCWSGAACREVTASAHQVHGAVGFALETGLHRYHRRAKAAQVWAATVCRTCG